MDPKPTRRTVLLASLSLPLLSGGAPGTEGKKTMQARAGRRPRVAVVGAGAFGGWTALCLARAGAEVTLLDAWGPGHARASSGGETRVIRSLYGPDRVYTDWVARSFAAWRESEARWGRQLYHPTGALWLFSTPDDYARTSLPLVREHGFTVAEIAPAEAARRFPQVGFEGVQSVFFEETAGYLLARRACAAVAEATVAEGGTYRELEARPGPLHAGGMERLELSDGSHLVADAYVFACGPWLGRLFPEVVGERVRPTRQEVFYFGTPAGDPRFREGALPTWVHFGERIFYGIPGNEHRGLKVADDTRGEPIDPTSSERTVTPEHLARAREVLARRFPALAGAPLVAAEVCQYENTPDGHFLLDRHPQAGNVWLVGGGSGHGFKLGPALGEYVAGLVLGEGQPHPQLALERLREIPPRPRTQFSSGKPE